MDSPETNDWMPFIILLSWLEPAPSLSLRARSSHYIENQLVRVVRANGGRVKATYWLYVPTLIPGNHEEQIVLIVEAKSEHTISKINRETDDEEYIEEEVVGIPATYGAMRIREALASLGEFVVLRIRQMYRTDQVIRGSRGMP